MDSCEAIHQAGNRERERSRAGVARGVACRKLSDVVFRFDHLIQLL